MMRRCWFRRSLMVVALAAAGAGAVRADDGRRGGAVRLLTTVPIPSPNHLVVFDISFIDPATQLYYLADRSDQAIDAVDAKGNVFVKQIRANFKGFTGSTDTSGPNGGVVSGNFPFGPD